MSVHEFHTGLGKTEYYTACGIPAYPVSWRKHYNTKLFRYRGERSCRLTGAGEILRNASLTMMHDELSMADEMNEIAGNGERSGIPAVRRHADGRGCADGGGVWLGSSCPVSGGQDPDGLWRVAAMISWCVWTRAGIDFIGSWWKDFSRKT